MESPSNSQSTVNPDDKTGTENNISNSFAMYDVLKELCQNNIEYFEKDDTSKGQRIHGALIGLIDHLQRARPLVQEIREFAPSYDFDEKTPGNGYRSFVFVVDSSVKHSVKLCRYIMENRNSLLFRKGIYMKEIESSNHLLASLCTCLKHLLTLHEWSEPGSLFPSGSHTAEELFSKEDTINQYCFYGRCLGFQFCESVRPILKFVAVCMAGFSEAYYSEGGTLARATSSMWTGGKYFLDPELRSRRIVNISQNSDVNFCKAFWFLAESELMSALPNVVCVNVKINKVLTIPPEPLTIKNELTNEEITIPIPFSHIGTGSIQARLISVGTREGMMGEKSNDSKKSILPPSKHLIFHCHGGGFVAQSSKSHEIYLREWAAKLNVPILSIDYSLAPQAPFPRACEEIFYSYCWALANCKYLGCTGEKIILVGDSAGANLNLGCAMKCIELGIRKPDGLFLAYCPTLVSFEPSPARLLCLMDPLLPFGFMMRCLKAYASPSEEINAQNKEHVDKMNDIKKAKAHNNNEPISCISTTTSGRLNDNLKSDIQTYVNVDLKTVPDDNNDNLTDNSDSFEENSVWEHVQASDSDMAHLEAHKSPISDGTSDTLAGASFRTTTLGNDMLTPDENNVVSLEEDSQPIEIHLPTTNGIEQTYEIKEGNEIDLNTGNGAVEALELDIDDEELKKQQSTQYVSEFIERYVLDQTIDESGNPRPILRTISRTQSEENIVFDVGREALSVQNLQEKLQNFALTVTSAVSSMTTSNPIRSTPSPFDDRSSLNALIARSPSDEFIFDVPKNPYLSPYWASDEILKQMPPTKFITLVLDPCLDDVVMFAKKLKNLGNDVGLDILEGLPHGFLNFSMLSKEAHQGSKLCIKRIAELLEIDLENNKSSGPETSTSSTSS